MGNRTDFAELDAEIARDCPELEGESRLLLKADAGGAALDKPENMADVENTLEERVRSR